ncbi:hypothetical protein [Actinomycetospora flava]|uniref:RHS repeat-associated protein n=1 Tax=Actinomycetospora flava TaxID=3129232 RepID=A0ABU8MDF0_9PSEU
MTQQHCFPPPPRPNFDRETGHPIEYRHDGTPFDPTTTDLTKPEGVDHYDPISGRPLDVHGRPIPNEHNPFGRWDFETAVEHRHGVDPSGHVIENRPVYDLNTGLPLRYDDFGNPLVPPTPTTKPPGVDHFDDRTGEPLDVFGEPVPGAVNPHQRPAYDDATGLPIHYDPHTGAPSLPQIHVDKPEGVHQYDPKTGDPLDENGDVVPGARNPHQNVDDKTLPDQPLHNFDPVTGVPLDKVDPVTGALEPITDLVPTHPANVVGFDPITGEPLDKDGKVVEDYDNPLGEHVFKNDVDLRDDVDPTGHVMSQRPMYDETTGKPITYDELGQPSLPATNLPKDPNIAGFDPDTGRPLDAAGKELPDARNPWQRPDYDTTNGLPIDYDKNGNPVPAPNVVVTVPPGVTSFDADTGRPLGVDGQPVDIENPFQRPEDREPKDGGDEGDDLRTQEENEGIEAEIAGEQGMPLLPETIDHTLVDPPVEGLPTTEPVGTTPAGTDLGTVGSSPFGGEASPVPQTQVPTTFPEPSSTTDPFGGAQTTVPVDEPFGTSQPSTPDTSSAPFQTTEPAPRAETREATEIPAQNSGGQEDLASSSSSHESSSSSDSGHEASSSSSSDSGSDSGAEASDDAVGVG